MAWYLDGEYSFHTWTWFLWRSENNIILWVNSWLLLLESLIVDLLMCHLHTAPSVVLARALYPMHYFVSFPNSTKFSTTQRLSTINYVISVSFVLIIHFKWLININNPKLIQWFIIWMLFRSFFSIKHFTIWRILLIFFLVLSNPISLPLKPIKTSFISEATH